LTTFPLTPRTYLQAQGEGAVQILSAAALRPYSAEPLKKINGCANTPLCVALAFFLQSAGSAGVHTPATH